MQNELGVGIIGFGRIGAEHAGWIAAASRHHTTGSDPTPRSNHFIGRSVDTSAGISGRYRGEAGGTAMTQQRDGRCNKVTPTWRNCSLTA